MESTKPPLSIGSMVWGVQDVPRAIQFWCAVLNYRLLREPSDDWAIITSQDGNEPQIALNQVTLHDTSKQRHHLDLYAADQGAEVRRILALGATRVEREYPKDADYIVLADPDGNHFCIIDKS